MASKSNSIDQNADAPVGHRLFEISGIAAFASVSIMLTVWLWEWALAYSALQLAFYIPTAIFMGWLLGDLSSGVVHWLGDTFGTEEMPILGAAFIKPFREHHVDPKGITRHDFVETNGNNCIVVCVGLYLPMSLLALMDNGPLRFWLVAVGLSLGLAVFMTNQIHKWSHLDNPPWYAILFQKAGLFMSPSHHDIHHTAPYDTYYCITTGWLNPIFDKTQFFPRAERVVRKIVSWIR